MSSVFAEKTFQLRLRNNLKRTYQLIYQSNLNLKPGCFKQIKAERNSIPDSTSEINNILEFIENSS